MMLLKENRYICFQSLSCLKKDFSLLSSSSILNFHASNFCTNANKK